MIRSPLFYVGDKYKLMDQLKDLFPKNINIYVEPFYGGGSSQLATVANEYILNDMNKYIILLHKYLYSFRNKKKTFFNKVFNEISIYGFSCSFNNNVVIPEELKKNYPKTYYAQFNKEAYNRLKQDYNKDKSNMLKLYLLLIYGFNHMIRFNKKGEFNLPVGNVDFNENVYNALNIYFDIQKNNNIRFYNTDFERFLNKINYDANTFVYLDPPYFISQSEYNKLWTEEDERRLYDYLDELNDRGIKFGITNLLKHKGNTNIIFEEWQKKYKSIHIKSNYISFNDNSIKGDSLELYVYNY